MKQTPLLDYIALPCFICKGERVNHTVNGLPYVRVFSPDTFVEVMKVASEKGVRRVLMFPYGVQRDNEASAAFTDENPLPRAISMLRKESLDIEIIVDICVCSYNKTSHCFLFQDGSSELPCNSNLEQKTLDHLTKQSLLYAQAGASAVMLSAMVDGVVGAVKDVLCNSQFSSVRVLNQSAKQDSGFYAPFRANTSGVQEIMKSEYQLNPQNLREGLREIRVDIIEGVDAVVLKPLLTSLDFFYHLQQDSIELAAFMTSGEYLMLKHAEVSLGMPSGKFISEVVSSALRAGASFVITYYGWELLEVSS